MTFVEKVIVWFGGMSIVGAIFFLMGADRGYKDAEEANRHDRIRLHCAAQPSDAMCLNVKN